MMTFIVITLFLLAFYAVAQAFTTSYSERRQQAAVHYADLYQVVKK